MNSGMICPRYTLLMKTRSTPKLAALCAFAALAGLMPLGPAHAGKGTISAVNRKCVSISTPALGTLVNTVRLATDIAPWTFGTRALYRNLAERGLLSAPH